MAHLDQGYDCIFVPWMAIAVKCMRRQIADLLTPTSSPLYQSRSSRSSFLESDLRSDLK